MLSIQHGDQNDANLIKKKKEKEKKGIKQMKITHAKLKLLHSTFPSSPAIKHCHCKFLPA